MNTPTPTPVLGKNPFTEFFRLLVHQTAFFVLPKPTFTQNLPAPCPNPTHIMHLNSHNAALIQPTPNPIPTKIMRPNCPKSALILPTYCPSTLYIQMTTCQLLANYLLDTC